MLTAIGRSTRMGMLGAVVLAAGVAVLIARPGIALAHHVMISSTVDCAGWETKAEYIGGNADRLAVVDVVINGEAISQSFYFDDHPGHLGHQDYYLLYERTGTGGLQTSGTITLYEKSHGNQYSIVADSDSTNIDLVCVTPTATAHATDTPTPAATATETAAAATPTAQLQGTITPLATETPVTTQTATEVSATPQPSQTAVAGGTTTPVGTDTVTPGGTTTAVPTATVTSSASAHTPTAPGGGSPTLTSSVRGITHGDTSTDAPGSPTGARRSLPPAGDGGRKRNAIVLLLFGLAVAVVGGVAFASGVRR